MVLPIKLGKKRATILVMGPTGSGKTTFANLVSRSNLQVGSSSASCTDRVQATREFDVDGCTVTLVDTPGLDHTYKTNDEALKSIEMFLVDQYERAELVTGVIYIHPIVDEEPAKIVRNLKAFEGICGDKALRNAAIVISKWDPGNSETTQTFEERERELRAGPFARAVQKGARIFRDERGKKSAREIVEYLVQKQPIPLEVQRSVVDGGLRLQHTGTGHILLRELSTDTQTQQKRLGSLRQPRGEEAQYANEATSSGIKLRRVKSGLQRPKRHGQKHHRMEKGSKLDLGEMMVFLCCGAALYAFLTILKQHTWYGVII